MDDNELSILDFARHHGLSRAYQEHNLHVDFDLSPRTSQLSSDLHDDDGLPPLLGSGFLSAEDRWVMDAVTALFLRDVLQRPDSEHGLGDQIMPIRGLRSLRLEEPALSTDGFLDFHRFKSCKSTSDITIKDISTGLAAEPVPESNRMSWPVRNKFLRDQARGTCGDERMQISTLSLDLLRDVTCIEKVRIDDDDTIRRSPKICMDSPLLPFSPASVAVDAEDDDFLVDLTSTPENPSRDLSRHLDDQVVRSPSSPLHLMSFDTLDPASQPSPTTAGDDDRGPMSKIQIQDLKIEAPLLTSETTSSPFKKVRFDDLVVRHDPTIHISSPAGSDASYQRFFDLVVDLAGPARLALDQEQLDETDCTLRLPVPPLVDPDHQAALDLKGHLPKLGQEAIVLLKTSLLQVDASWPLKRLNGSLPWNPIPGIIVSDLLTESIDDAESSYYMVSIATDDAFLDNCFWKPEGLRVLDVLEDEEGVLRPQDFDPVKPDLAISVHHRRRSFHPDDPVDILKKRPRLSLKQAPSRLIGTSSALQSFFQTQTGQVAPPTSQQKVSAKTDESSAEVGNTNETHVSGNIHNVDRLAEATMTKGSRITFGIPRIDQDQIPNTVILNATILSERSMIRDLHAYLSSTKFLERDASSTEEADIMLPPSTGLIITTLQKLKQRALPGDRSSPDGLRIRLQRLGFRYERLTVLIHAYTGTTTGYASSGPPTLSKSDVVEMNELSSFGASLPCDFSAMMVMGPASDFCAWTAAQLCSAEVLSQPTTFSWTEESQQELFLRQAGFSVGASLTILSRASAGATLGSPQARSLGHSLSEFVLTPKDLRRNIYGQMLGGTRVLERVSRVLDQKRRAIDAVRSHGIGG